MPKSSARDQPWLRIDLNLLKSLYVLVEEKNISRAADRFFVTRSAMSKTLKRLRDTLNDPILVRTSDGLVPTPKALKLAESLSAAILSIEEGLMSSIEFDPAITTGTLRIAAPETFALGVMPILFPALHRSAPYLKLESLHLDDHYLEHLQDGTLDFAIYFDQHYPEEFVAHNLLQTQPVIWCRKKHPLTRLKNVTLEDICSFPKLSLHLPTIDMAELIPVLKKMEELEHDRELFFETSHLLAATLVMSDSDALVISSDFLFRHRLFQQELTSISLEHIDLFRGLKIELSLLQHERTLKSPLHNWVLDQIATGLLPGTAT